MGQAKEEVVIIEGDFNARIGRKGMLYNGEEYRRKTGKKEHKR